MPHSSISRLLCRNLSGSLLALPSLQMGVRTFLASPLLSPTPLKFSLPSPLPFFPTLHTPPYSAFVTSYVLVTSSPSFNASFPPISSTPPFAQLNFLSYHNRFPVLHARLISGRRFGRESLWKIRVRAWDSMARVRFSSARSFLAQSTKYDESGSWEGTSWDGGIEGYFNRVKECNAGKERKNEFLPFVVDGHVIGFVHHSTWSRLNQFHQTLILRPPDSFGKDHLASRHLTSVSLFVDSTSFNNGVVCLHPSVESTDLTQRSKSIADVLLQLKRQGAVTGWRDELYAVGLSFGVSPCFLIERAAAPLFGIKVYGVHINGYVVRSDGSCHLWVAKRSKTKQTYPGRLDHIVAGGQPYNLGCMENVMKECEEEAGIPPTLSCRAVPVGAVSYETIQGSRMKRDVLFCYDIQLPEDFVPVNQDGEVEEFRLLPIHEVQRLLLTTTQYKTNCAVVIIDFLVRHGYITPEEPKYLDLLSSLKQGDCS